MSRLFLHPKIIVYSRTAAEREDAMNFTTTTNKPIPIGLDHGFGQMKTAHTCFKTGVTAHDKEPTFKSNLLIYEGRYYTIGEEHKEFIPDKAQDQDYYLLTLAAVAQELHFRGVTSARVFLGAGLPLTWVSEQRDSFKKYLLQKPDAALSFRGVDYRIEFVGAEVYPQGFAAIADRLSEFRGVNMLCDIGTGTMNVMLIRNGKPIPSQCYTEKYGVWQCALSVREKLVQKFGTTVDDGIIEDVLRYGKSDIGEKYLAVIQHCARDYANGIMKRLREHEYNPELMRLYVVGGGSCLIRHFTEYDAARVTINDDICATAKGYERLAEAALRKTGGVA